MIDFTTVVVVDEKTLPQWVVSAPTWRLNAPEIWQQPLVVIYDAAQLNVMVLKWIQLKLLHPNIQFVAWEPEHEYQSQRAKMLAAHFFLAPQCAQTEWLLKLDTDAICERPANWLDAKYFAPLEDGREIVAACPGWGYSLVERGSPAIFNRWADIALAGTEPIQFTLNENGSKAYHKRFCSWIAFYRMGWVRWCASLCTVHTSGKMPIESEDGMRSMIAARTGAPWRSYPAKRNTGWRNYARFQKLRERAKEVLAGATA